MPDNDRFRRISAALIQVLSRGAWPIIAIGVLLALLSVYYAYHNLIISTSRDALVASDLHLIRLSDKIDKEFGARDELVVVVENAHRGRAIAFAQALAAELKKYPRQFPELFYRVNPDALKQWALLYLEPSQLRELKDKLQDHRREIAGLAADPSLTNFFQVVNEEITRALIGHLFTSFLEEAKEKERIPDLGLLNSTLQQIYLQVAEGKPYQSPLKSLFPGDFGDFRQEGYFITENDKYLLFLITPKKDGYSTSLRTVNLLRQIIGRVKKDFPGLRVGVTGPAALEDDEMSSALSDITLATWLSLIIQMGLLVLFFRSFKRTLAEGVVLIIGLCWVFGMTTLVVGRLNILSMIFAPLILGMTIDYGIHWYAHLEEEQGDSRNCSTETLISNFRGIAPGIIFSSVASIVSFLPLLFVGFKGLSELGAILALGVPLMALATIVLLPCLTVVTERCRGPQEERHSSGTPRPFLSLRWQHPVPIVVLGLLVTALGGVGMLYVHFDLNPLHLQNQKTESVLWELKLIKDSKYSTSYGTMIATSLQELPGKTAALKELPTVSHVESILSFMPDDVPKKQKLIKELAPLVTGLTFSHTIPTPVQPEKLTATLGRIRFKLSEAEEQDWKPENKPTQKQLQEVNRYLGQLVDLLKDPSPGVISRLSAFEKDFIADIKDRWGLLQANLTAPPFDLQDLPEDVRQRFTSPAGTYLIRVFPSQDIWNPKPLEKFVQDLRNVDPNVVGDPILLYHFTYAFRNACILAASIATVAVTLLLFLLLRSLRLTLIALIPLFVGTAWTLNMMWLLNIPFNQANVLFLPLILGEGIEYGIFIIVRWKMEASARAITLPASTAKGVLLSALTTSLGFGILMISGHRGVFSLGLLAAVGALSVLLAALSVMPAFLRLLEKHRGKPQPDTHPLLGLRRWLHHMARREETQ